MHGQVQDGSMISLKNVSRIEAAERDEDQRVAQIAAVIGERARARMLFLLVDGRARTATELAMAAEVSASTASVHLQKLAAARLVKVMAQGKHRYYSLEGARVARALEGLSVVAGDGAGAQRLKAERKLAPNTPSRLRAARTCYDHIAGILGVALHERMHAMGWLAARRNNGARDAEYELTRAGQAGLAMLGIDFEATRRTRRRFAYACLDWSERRPHIAGALGAAVLEFALRKRWVVQALDSRALEVTTRGRLEMMSRFGVRI